MHVRGANQNSLNKIHRKLPTNRELGFGVIRLASALFIALLVWQKTDIKNSINDHYKIVTEKIVRLIETPKVSIEDVASETTPGESAVRTTYEWRNIKAELDAITYFNIFLSMIIIFSLPYKHFGNTLLKLILAGLFMGTLNLVLTVAHGYHMYNLRETGNDTYVHTLPVDKMILALSYYILPITVVCITYLFVEKTFSRMQQLAEVRTEKQPINKNNPCPCGSGRKYKKCCGS